VSFGSGQEVLNAYWGFLGDGGLVIADDVGLEQGESVRLQVRVASLESEFALAGRVVRARPGRGGAVVAFDPGQPQDMLLSAAIAEADDVPARESRRYDVDELVELRANGQSAEARVVNVSESGCCLRLDAAGRDALPAGELEVRIEGPHFTARGTIVWSNSSERGVHFHEAPGLRGRIHDWVVGGDDKK